jgi:hypothetical protein
MLRTCKPLVNSAAHRRSPSGAMAAIALFGYEGWVQFAIGVISPVRNTISGIPNLQFLLISDDLTILSGRCRHRPTPT